MGNYLFNGVDLPELPEWDKTTYPYAVIDHWGAGNPVDTAMVVLIVSTQPITFYAQTNTYVYSTIKPPTLSWRVYSENIENYNQWTPWVDGTNAFEVGNEHLIWANHDLVIGSINTLFAPKPTEWAVGDLVLAASDPIPVLTLTARDLYRKINGKPTKLTLYKKVGGKLVALDEHTKEVKT